jgi:sporulation protein YlmC with PRC-barrel domain
MSFKTATSLAALALALGLSPQGLAQTAPGPKPPAAEQVPKTPVAGQIMIQDANTVLASRDLIGQTVYAPDDAKIGSISDLIISKDGKNIQGFVIGIGGFLGIGERSVALQMDKLKITPAADGSAKLTMDVKREELVNAPAFKSLREVELERKRNQAQNQPPMQQRKN